jgi:hypothetical protein
MAIRTSTTVDRFPTVLATALAARAALAGVSVTDGIPPPGTFGGPEWIAITDVVFEQEVRGLNVSSRPRIERYTQSIMISVVVAGRTPQTVANARAWELFVEIEETIRDNVYLDGFWTGDGQIVSVQTGRGTLSKRATDTEREATLELELDVVARI